MTEHTSSSTQQVQNQDIKINYTDNSATHLCILIRWRVAPPPAALANGAWSPC